MNSKRWLGAVMILLALVLAAFVFLRRTAPTPDGHRATIPRQDRSMVLVTIDTTRADRLEPYGATDVATPTLQRLADRGVVFENAYAVAPITLVSHTSILTGLYPPQHGVRNNGTHYVPDDLVSLAEVLSDEGYRTGAFVSAAVLEKRYGLDQGFEFYDDDLSTGRERHPRMVPDRPAEATVDSAAAWLEGVGDDENFFLWVHLYDPHASYSPPAPFRDEYRERPYDGEIAYMDAEIGRLLQHPRLAGDSDLVTFVMADHGESLGEHGEKTHAILAYDSTLHIPWIARIPGGPSGARIQAPVSHVDFMPTALDLLGIDMPAPEGENAQARTVAGKSLMPLFEGARITENRGLYSETWLPYYTYGWAKLQVLHKARWKFIDAPTPELFDRQRDPRELSNRHDQEPGMAHDMRRDLDEMLETLGGAENEASLELDSDALEKLRSLGYLAVGSGAPAGGDDRERPDPKDVIDLHVGLERARQLSRDRLYDQAILQVRKVLQRDPNNLAALTDLAGYLESNDDIEEAIATVEQALALDPNYSRLYMVMSNLEARRGEFEQALALVDRALEIEPRSLEGRLQRVTRLLQVQRIQEAQGEMVTLLEEYPDSPQVLVSHVQSVDLPGGDLEAAENRLRRSLELDPFLLAGWRLLGEVLEMGERSSDATEAWRQGLERQPDSPDLHARLGLALARVGGGADARVHLEEAIRLSPTFRPDLHVALGGWLSEHGRFEEAQAVYDKVFEVDPANPAARNNRAIALYRKGSAKEALAMLEALVEEFPQYADAHNNLSAVAVERQDWATAERHARLALEINPRAPQALNNLGLALEQTERFPDARDAYERALELEPGYWQARFNLGVLLVRTDRPRAAEEALNQVLEQIPEYPEVHYQLGVLYAGTLADPVRARQHLNAFVRMAAPKHPWVEDARQKLSGLPVVDGP